MSRNKHRDSHIDKLNRREKLKTAALCIAIILAVILACIVLPHYMKTEY